MHTHVTDHVVADSLAGHPVEDRWSDAVPRIPDELLDTSVYLYPDRVSAQMGKAVGGTGFMTNLPLPGTDLNAWFVVTNRHVIEQGSCVVRSNMVDGLHHHTMETLEKGWKFCPKGTDIAVHIFAVSNEKAKGRNISEIIANRTIPLSSMITYDEFCEHDIGVGDDVFMVGRFINRDGLQTNVPTVRFGNIAQNFPKHPKDQDQIYYETRSIGGFSGSPLFFHIYAASYRPKDGKLTPGYAGPRLLGINAGHTGYKEPVRDSAGNENQYGYYVQANAGLSNAVPAWHLRDMLTGDTMKEVLDRGSKYVLGERQEVVDAAPVDRSEASVAGDEVLKKMLNTPPKPHE